MDLDEPRLLLSALKPAQSRDGVVLRLLNPTDEPHQARVRLGFAVKTAESVRLDEAPQTGVVRLEGNELVLTVRPHGLESVLLR